jgi:gluconokinase
MEGVMYRMFSLYEILSGLNDNVKQVRANGGYVNSEIWLAIQADIFGREIAVAGIGEATAFGAAYAAMAATGAIRDMKVPLPAMEPRRIILPDLSRHEIYKEGFSKFKDLYRRIYT